MDLFGPLKKIPLGKKFILFVTDAFSQYVELVAIPDKSPAAVGSAVFSRWLYRYGLSLEIVSDNGKELCDEEVEIMLKIMNIKKTKTTPYHP